MFNTCTEELKKIDLTVQQHAGNLHNILHNSARQDLDMTNLKGSLTLISKEMHGLAQGILESCARLSLLSFNTLVQLMKIWVIGPQQDVDFVDQCMSLMFEGISSLNIQHSHSSALVISKMNRWKTINLKIVGDLHRSYQLRW